MRKVLKIALVFAILVFCNITVSNAATNEELIAYASKKFDVNGTTVSLKAADRVKLQRYLKENPVSEAQADQIIEKINSGVELLRKENVTDPTKLSSAKKQELVSIAQSAAKVAGVDLTVSKDGVISAYKDGKKIDEFTSSTALVQTGSEDYSYIVYAIAGVAVVAIAGVVVFTKKGKVNA